MIAATPPLALAHMLAHRWRPRRSVSLQSLLVAGQPQGERKTAPAPSDAIVVSPLLYSIADRGHAPGRSAPDYLDLRAARGPIGSGRRYRAAHWAGMVFSRARRDGTHVLKRRLRMECGAKA
jgi:hypothetical protein